MSETNDRVMAQIKTDEAEHALKMRGFETGALRTDDTDKPDYEGYLSPFVIEEYGRYCLKHQYKNTPQERASDNWQLGMSPKVYMKSMYRHFLEVHKMHRNGGSSTDMRDALCALMFNVMGYLHEYLKEV